MRCNEVPIWMYDPVTLEIKLKFGSLSKAARHFSVSRQAIHDALKKKHRVKGFHITTPDAYEQLKE